MAPSRWTSSNQPLEESPDAFGSTFEAENASADAEWAKRLVFGVDSSQDLPLIAEIEGEPIGLAWGRIEPSEPEIASLYQMWVAPGRRRLGTGRMLLEAVIAWATASNAHSLMLSVTCDNIAAHRLYLQRGFEQIGEPEPLRSESAQLLQFKMRLALREGGA